MVSLRSGGSSPVRASPNLYQAGGRQDRRRVGRVRSRGNSGAQHSALFGVAAFKRTLEPELDRGRGMVFSSDGNLRGRGNDCVFSAVPKRRAAIGRADGAGGRGGADGFGRNCVLQGAFRMAATTWNRAGGGRFVLIAVACGKIKP